MRVGDLVVRISHKRDIIFRIVAISDKTAILSGKYIRLKADADISDLEIVGIEKITEEKQKASKIRGSVAKEIKKRRGFLAGKVLHIDGDGEYLEECLELYRRVGVYAIGVYYDEQEMATHVATLMKLHHPDIVVITGHDAFNQQNRSDLRNYMNTENFIHVVKKIRDYHGKDDCLIIAGACGSHFEALIAAGANLATSPERVNIHAYDPTVAAIICAYTPFNKQVNLEDILKFAYVNRNGLGGIETYGKMRLLL